MLQAFILRAASNRAWCSNDVCLPVLCSLLNLAPDMISLPADGLAATGSQADVAAGEAGADGEQERTEGAVRGRSSGDSSTGASSQAAAAAPKDLLVGHRYAPRNTVVLSGCSCCVCWYLCCRAVGTQLPAYSISLRRRLISSSSSCAVYYTRWWQPVHNAVMPCAVVVYRRWGYFPMLRHLRATSAKTMQAPALAVLTVVRRSADEAPAVAAEAPAGVLHMPPCAAVNSRSCI